MKKLLSFALSLAVALACAACAAPAPAAEPAPADGASAENPYAALAPVVLIGADSTGKGAAGQIFGEMVAAKAAQITGGRLTIDYHPNGELGGDADLLRQAKDGDIAIVVCQTAPVVNFIPEMAVFDLPMVFAKYEGDVIDRVLNGDNALHSALSAAYCAAGYHLLGFMQNATYRLTTANVELRSLEAFQGLQIRTMENSNHMAFWTAIGAQPTPLAWAEVYFALQSGTIDAQENAADTCVGANFQEVQQYLACTNHILYVNQILINDAVFQELEPAYQAALTQAVSESLAVMNPQLKQIDMDNKDRLIDGGMTLVEYDAAFYDSILAQEGVQALYQEIDHQVNGLGTLLQEALDAADAHSPA